MTPCPHGDLTCPCADGDLCHYEPYTLASGVETPAARCRNAYCPTCFGSEPIARPWGTSHDD